MGGEGGPEEDLRDGLVPQVVATSFSSLPTPHVGGGGGGKGGELGGKGAHRKAALTPLRLAGGLAFTWFLLFSP